MDCSPPGASVHEILQARILQWFAISFSRGSSRPRDGTWVSCIACRFFIFWATRVSESESEVAQSCLTLCDPMDFSPPGSSAHGILQARILEWVAVSISRGSSWTRNQAQVSLTAEILYHLSDIKEKQIWGWGGKERLPGEEDMASGELGSRWEDDF